MSWSRVVGRVSFINCEPIFHGLSEDWAVLAAPPSWLTGHLLRKDCILAPIPAADYARNRHELVLVPDLAISSKGEVGSVVLFSKVGFDMESVALPSDSATSVALLKYILQSKGISVKYCEMGPDFEEMMKDNDACLLIGDRALEAARSHPEMVCMDLGMEWRKHSNHPMVFGVFAARKDSDKELVRIAHSALMERLSEFESNSETRDMVIDVSIAKTGQSRERLEKYFGEVINRMDSEDLDGLNYFLKHVCNMDQPAEFCW